MDYINTLDAVNLIDPMFNMLEHADAKTIITFGVESLLTGLIEAVVTLIRAIFHLKIHWRNLKNWVLPEHMQRKQKPAGFMGIEHPESMPSHHHVPRVSNSYQISDDREATIMTRFFEMLE